MIRYDARYPVEPMSRLATKTYDVSRVGAHTALNYDDILVRTPARGTLWQLQETVAAARFECLRLAIDKGQVPVAGREPRVTVEVRVMYDVIDSACAGIAINDDRQHITVAHQQPLQW